MSSIFYKSILIYREYSLFSNYYAMRNFKNSKP